MEQVVRLVANNELPLPKVTVEADGLLEAAALGLLDFHRMGRSLDPNATVDVDSEAYGLRCTKVKDILDWLRDSEDGRAFVEANRLHTLLD